MNHTLEKLDAGDPVLGAWVLSGSRRVAEVMARTELDWLGIDTEHAPYSPERVESLVTTIASKATPIVRLPSVDAAVAGKAKQALDVGAGGVIIPNVETVEQAESAVAAAQFPPAGRRGVAGTVRANEYGEAFDEYIDRANEQTLIAFQIESQQGAASADDILAVEGLDVVLIGSNDLSASMGYPGDKNHPEVRAAIEGVFEAARTHDVVPGIAGRTPAEKDKLIGEGFQFILLGADVSFMRSGVAPFFSE